MNKKPRNLLQFSLRGVLILALVISPPLAWIGYLKRAGQRYRRAVASLESDFEVHRAGHQPTNYMDFVEKYVDADAFSQAHSVTWQGRTAIHPEMAQRILEVQPMLLYASKSERFPSVILPGKIEWSDRELLLLAKNPPLQLLELDGKYSTKAVQEICKLPLQGLTLPDVPIDDDLAASVATCRTLGHIGFNFQNASTNQIELIASLPKLHAISIYGSPERPECLSSFSACKSINILMILDSHLTPEASKALSKVSIGNLQLINCTMEKGFFANFGEEARYLQLTIGRTGQKTISSYASDPKLVELESK